jgi:flagellar hook-associated protein 1 FlgK
LASGLTFELNKIHAGGQGLAGFGSVIGTTTVTDPAKALNDPDSGLKQLPANGSFVVHVKDKATGLNTSTLVKVDLPDDGSGTSLADLDRPTRRRRRHHRRQQRRPPADHRRQRPGHRDQLQPGQQRRARGPGREQLLHRHRRQDDRRERGAGKNPSLLAAAKNGNSGDNQTARAIAGLETATLKSMNGGTLKSAYEGMVTEVATASSSATANAEASAAVTETLQAQRESLSGVSLDEEAINLMKFQRAFQGAARLVSVVDELMDTMLGMVR